MWTAINSLFEAIEELIGIFCSGVWRGVEGSINFLQDKTEETISFGRKQARSIRRLLLVLSGIAVFFPLLFFIIGIWVGAKPLILIGVLISSVSIMLIGFYIPFWGYVIALAFSASREFADRVARGIVGIVMWEFVVATYCLLLPIEININSTILVLMGAIIFALAVAHWDIQSNLLKRLVILFSIFLLIFGTLSLILPNTFNAFSVEKEGLDTAVSIRMKKEMKRLSHFVSGTAISAKKAISTSVKKEKHFVLSSYQEMNTGVVVEEGENLRIYIDNSIRIKLRHTSKWKVLNQNSLVPVKGSGELVVRAGDKPVKGKITVK